jgi:Zn-dependent peptidase ImmA (M78 family)
MIVDTGKTFFILLKEELPPEVKLFSIIHEYGHLALNLLHSNPQEYDAAVERKINLWAVDYLRPWININFYYDLLSQFSRDEHEGYKFILNNLKERKRFILS